MYSTHDAKTSKHSSAVGDAVGLGAAVGLPGYAVGDGDGGRGLGAGVCAVGAGVGLSTGAAVGFPGATDGRRVGAALTRQKPQEKSQ